MNDKEKSENSQPKFKPIIEGANKLSLGISMVVAILIGVGIGKVMENLFGLRWLFWLGVFWGISAAGLNIYKMYKVLKKELDEIKDDPKYRYYNSNRQDEDNDKFCEKKREFRSSEYHPHI
jgi:F0F1-type ATP synthase assembly protein I